MRRTGQVDVTPTTQDLDSEGWAASLEIKKNELSRGVPFFRIRNPAAVDTERYG